MAGMPQLSGAYSHYVSASPMLQVLSPEASVNTQLGVVQAGAGYGAPANKLQRSDRIEVTSSLPCFLSFSYLICMVFAVCLSVCLAVFFVTDSTALFIYVELT